MWCKAGVMSTLEYLKRHVNDITTGKRLASKLKSPEETGGQLGQRDL